MKVLCIVTMALTLAIGLPFGVIALLSKGIEKLAEACFNGIGWVFEWAEGRLKQEEYADEKAREARFKAIQGLGR